MPQASGARLSPVERKAQILAAARVLLEERELDTLSVDSIAREAGVSPGLLFHYFGSLRKLRGAIVQSVAEELLDHVAPDPALSAEEQLRNGIGAFIDQVALRPSVYLAVVRLTHSDPEMRRLHGSVRAAFVDWIMTGLTAAGAPRSPALALTVKGWQAYMEEVVTSWLDHRALSRTELVDLCERSCYQLVAAALGDADLWARVRERLGVRP
ncbi:TetR/AcrR family transcriptional regulator [Streptomyces sp. NBC_01803]|uniref:TetR/AcrR family transcriptional regulator n=1 Tax=Streptomyces sp. NBC_01803 TaxID=2975946 RepID=UPI002DD9798B|nr:TetR/AcrR family transcriptional regulator [Streptomyces sp. NBC_01803]WSA43173.1 TetR/AcrR family transcriptional regulator [Streptomyces sp. NBC_01803]